MHENLHFLFMGWSGSSCNRESQQKLPKMKNAPPLSALVMAFSPSIESETKPRQPSTRATHTSDVSKLRPGAFFDSEVLCKVCVYACRCLWTPENKPGFISSSMGLDALFWPSGVLHTHGNYPDRHLHKNKNKSNKY